MMVDGDPQQRAELSKAFSEYMPNAVDGGCGWHIVEQGWKVHGPGKTGVRDVGGKRDKYNIFRKRVKNWLYSWMTPGGVESEDKYYVSKQLLFSYLASSEVLDACDGQIYVVEQVSKFIREYLSADLILYPFLQTVSHSKIPLPCHRSSYIMIECSGP